MSGEALSIGVDVYHMQGEVMVNVVEMMGLMVDSREMMLGYENIYGMPIMMSDGWYLLCY